MIEKGEREREKREPPTRTYVINPVSLSDEIPDGPPDFYIGIVNR